MAEENLDPGTAEVHANNLIRGFKGFEHAAAILKTANEQRHWMETSKQERTALEAEVTKLKVERVNATRAVETAKRTQAAAEEAARLAQVEAKAAEEQCAARIRAAQDNQGARLKELEDALEGRRRMLESDMAARRSDLEEQIGTRQRTLSEVTAQIEALRNRL